MIKIDKVILLKKHLKQFKYKYTEDDKYVSGVLVKGKETTIDFKAAPFPVDANTLKLYPQGTVNVDDILLYTKKVLNNVNGEVVRVSTQESYRIFDIVKYLEVADLKVYLVKRVDSNG